MNFSESVQNYFLKWNDVNTRVSRSEYWWATFFLEIIMFIEIQSLSGGFGDISGFGAVVAVLSAIQVIMLIAALVFTFIASTTLSVRRLHDVGRSGWWLLISLTIVGLVPLFYWSVLPGTQGANRFGPDPLEKKTSDAEVRSANS